MEEEPQEVVIVGQRVNQGDTLRMFDVMIGVFETILRDPIRLLQLARLVKLCENLRGALDQLEG